MKHNVLFHQKYFKLVIYLCENSTRQSCFVNHLKDHTQLCTEDIVTMEKSGCPSDARSGISGEYPWQGQCTVAQSQDTEEAEVSRCVVLSY